MWVEQEEMKEPECDASLTPLSEFGIALQVDADEEEDNGINSYCLIDGKKVHKKTLVRCAFLPKQMSTDRIRRVRGHQK